MPRTFGPRCGCCVGMHESAEGLCSTLELRRRRLSEIAVAHREVRRLAQALAAPTHPVGNPFDHLLNRDARITKQAHGQLAIAQKCVARLAATEVHWFAE